MEDMLHKVTLLPVYERQHSARTATLAKTLAYELGYGISESKNIGTLAMMHDIGKCEIPKEILQKKGRLTEKEWDIIKKHPIISEQILLKEGFSKHNALIVRCHHEKLDGSGYPDGLEGNKIPFESQLISVADIYDALISKREYRVNLPGYKYDHDSAINIMFNTKGLNTDIIRKLNKILIINKIECPVFSF